MLNVTRHMSWYFLVFFLLLFNMTRCLHVAGRSLDLPSDKSNCSTRSMTLHIPMNIWEWNRIVFWSTKCVVSMFHSFFLSFVHFSFFFFFFIHVCIDLSYQLKLIGHLFTCGSQCSLKTTASSGFIAWIFIVLFIILGQTKQAYRLSVANWWPIVALIVNSINWFTVLNERIQWIVALNRREIFMFIISVRESNSICRTDSTDE
jgi:hypothetical protein